MLFYIVSQHTQKEMATGMVLRRRIDETNMKVWFNTSKRSLNPGRSLSADTVSFLDNSSAVRLVRITWIPSRLAAWLIFCYRCFQLRRLSVMVMSTCFATFWRLISCPTRRAIAAFPSSSPFAINTTTCVKVFSVHTNNSSRTRSQPHCMHTSFPRVDLGSEICRLSYRVYL